MESNANNSRPTRSTTPDLAVALRDPERVMHLATPDVGANSLSYLTALTEPVAMTIKNAAPSFMGHVFAARTVMKPSEVVVCTVDRGLRPY